MINLLPPEYKKTMNKESSKRVVVVFVILFAIGTIIASVLLSPSFLLIRSMNKYAEGELAGIMKVFGEETGTSASTLIAERNEQLSYFFNADTFPIMPTDSFDLILGQLDEGITVTNLFYKPETVEKTIKGKDGEKDKVTRTTKYMIGLAGSADSRDGLLELKRKLESLPEIEAVELPIGSFVENQDIEFSIEIEMRNE